MKTIIIEKNDSFVRVDNFLKKSFPKLTLSQIYKFLRTKKIKVNSKKVEPNYKLNIGDKLDLYIFDDLLEKNSEKTFLTTTKSIEIVFEDDNIMVVNKPFGLVVHEDNDNTVDTLINRVKNYLFKTKKWDPEKEHSFTPSLVNRIDRNTCGLILVAKNAESLRILNEKIRSREIDKFYLCLVYGIIDPKEGTLRDFLTRNELNKVVTVTKKPINKDSKEIITKYKTLKHKNNVSLLKIELLTGRTHQIRSHLNYIGHPLVGERKYSTKEYVKDPRFKYQALCSYKIVFSFTTNAGCLSYLKNKSVEISPPDIFNV